MRNIILLIAVVLIVGVGIFMLYKKEEKPQQAVIAFAGDTMLGRLVNEKIGHAGYNYPLGNLVPILHKTDLNVINLETTLTKSNNPVPKVFNFKALPDRVQTLKAGRIDVVNIANNHIKDFGDEGLLETVATLDKAGIKHVGAGKNIEAARKPVILERNGIKIGIIGYTDNEPTWKAGPDKPGTNYFNVGDIKSIKKDIARIRDKVDILIASQQWGPNMREHPTPEFINFAHQMVNAGVDIIHGHSAHIFQGVGTIHNKKLVLYDTGDFVDDYRVTPEVRNDLSFLFLVTVNKSGPKKLELIPIRIDNMQVNLAEGHDKTWALERMQKLSEKLGTTISNDGTLVIEN